MTDKGLLAPVIAGICVGVTLIALFASQMDSPIPLLRPSANTSEPPLVTLVVTDSVNNLEKYAGERGSYCWGNICADTAILIPDRVVEVNRGSMIQFEYIDSYHGNRPPDELALVAYSMDHLEVFSRVGDLQIATYDYSSPSSPPYLKDIGNHKFVVTLTEGDYVLSAFSAWYYKGDPVASDGDVGYFYRISVH